MSHVTWITPKGQVGQFTKDEYSEFKLDAVEGNGSPVKFRLIAGSLPPGVYLSSDGTIKGVPTYTTPVGSLGIQTTFTVRAAAVNGDVADRSFFIVVRESTLPQIAQKSIENGLLGAFFSGQKVNLQLTTTTGLSGLSWSVIQGSLPEGLTLSPDGLISGYVLPVQQIADLNEAAWDKAVWDKLAWDPPPNRPLTVRSSFSVRVTDGSNYDQANFTMEVRLRSTLTTDTTQVTADDTALTIDLLNRHRPIMITLPNELPELRQGSKFAFKFKGLDPDGDTLNFAVLTSTTGLFDQGPTIEDPGLATGPFDSGRFDQTASSLPTTIRLDPFTGWMTGSVPTQIEEERTYTFIVYCFKQSDPTYASDLVTFNLKVLRSLGETITWTTPSLLQSLNNGELSELSVSAVSSTNRTLIYRIKPGTKSRLPQGLILLPDGTISGRVSFITSTLDNNRTTFDRKTTTIDETYSFTVVAKDTSNAISSEKTFTVRIRQVNETPYENLYLAALLNDAQRSQFLSIVNNTAVFPHELMYRSNDSYFGRAKRMQLLFLPGLEPTAISDYALAMVNNHYRKRLKFSEAKTAVALDEDFNVKYEVVYLEVVDPKTANGKSPSIKTDITGKLSAQYNVDPYTTLYSNSLQNMITELGVVEQINPGAIPRWMTSRQPDGRILGFRHAVVLAYTVPGASKLIAYRLNQNNVRFDTIDFVVDRYNLDNSLSKHFNINEGKFNRSTETTFDRLPPVTGGTPFAGAVDFAVSVPFDEINGRTLGYILGAGGIDGAIDIQDGDTLIFARQENYNAIAAKTIIVRDPWDGNPFDSEGYNESGQAQGPYTSDNHGWNSNGAFYDVDGFAARSYDQSAVIPGYYDKINNPGSGIQNQRAGIWQVQIDEDTGLVTLQFIKEVELGQYVFVRRGYTYGMSQLFYDPNVKIGLTAPDYSLLNADSRLTNSPTLFDNNATRFFNDRDEYMPANEGNVSLKFPKTNLYR